MISLILLVHWDVFLSKFSSGLWYHFSGGGSFNYYWTFLLFSSFLFLITKFSYWLLWNGLPSEWCVWVAPRLAFYKRLMLRGGRALSQSKHPSPWRELRLRQEVQGLKEEVTILTHAFLKPYAQCILPKNCLSLGPELMTTQHNALLMEMLFLGSMLMILIVTNVAWEPVSQDLSPWLHSNSISHPETFT